MNESIIVLRVTHRKPIQDLGGLVANRAWTIDNVVAAEVISLGAAAPQLTPINGAIHAQHPVSARR